MLVDGGIDFFDSYYICLLFIYILRIDLNIILLVNYFGILLVNIIS